MQLDCEHRQKIHRNRVRSARAIVNTAPPEDFLHFHYNAKKCMQHAERLFDVERVWSFPKTAVLAPLTQAKPSYPCHEVQGNRILLEKMTKYAEYNGAAAHRPWASRSSVNFKNGFVLRPGTGLHIDNLHVPVSIGAAAAGNTKKDYQKRKVPFLLTLQILGHFCKAMLLL
jgi:hypothetical protein